MTDRFPIIFVGAGPGDPELITVKGQKALARADLCFMPAPWYLRRC